MSQSLKECYNPSDQFRFDAIINFRARKIKLIAHLRANPKTTIHIGGVLSIYLEKFIRIHIDGEDSTSKTLNCLIVSAETGENVNIALPKLT